MNLTTPSLSSSNLEQLAWILPHFCCPDCDHVDILVDVVDYPKWLAFGIQYIDRVGGFECGLCKRKFNSLGFLDTHLLKEECVEKDKINEYRIINANEMDEPKSTPEFRDKCFKMIHGKKLRPEWTEVEIQKLIELRADGKTNQEIAIELGKKPPAITAKIMKLIEEGKIEKKRMPLTDEEIAKLIELRKQDKSTKEIADLMGKTLGTITGNITRLMKEGKLETNRKEIDDDLLIDYVKNYYKTSSIREIAEVFDISEGAIYTKLLKVVGRDWKKTLGLEEEVKPVVKPKALKVKSEKVLMKEKIEELKTKYRTSPLKGKGRKKQHKKEKEMKLVRWSNHDIKVLLKSESGMSMLEIAKKLKRSVGSCYVKRSELRQKRK